MTHTLTIDSPPPSHVTRPVVPGLAEAIIAAANQRPGVWIGVENLAPSTADRLRYRINAAHGTRYEVRGSGRREQRRSVHVRLRTGAPAPVATIRTTAPATTLRRGWFRQVAA